MQNGMNMNHTAGINTTAQPHRRMMMHMTFYWSKNALVLFSGWPGTSSGMYVLSLFFVFVLAIIVEYLSNSRLIKQSMSKVTAGLIQTGLHAVRVGLAYMVMLAVMSFNGGIFIAAVLGHSVGFLLFGSRVFRNNDDGDISDLPAMSC